MINAEILKQVEKELLDETAKQNAAVKELAAKPKAPIRDARKLLDAYKDTRKMDINEGLPKMMDEWTPLEYVRHFAVNKKKITVDQRFIYFGRVKFNKNTKTNFQVLFA